MRFLSFEQWTQLNPMPPLKLCPFCDGDGRAEHRERYEAEKEDIMAKLSAWRVQ